MRKVPLIILILGVMTLIIMLVLYGEKQPEKHQMKDTPTISDANYDEIIEKISNSIKSADIGNSETLTEDVEKVTNSKYTKSLGSGRIIFEFQYDEHLHFYYDDNDLNEIKCSFFLDNNPEPYKVIAFIQK